ncbi:MAG: hypothetical protein FJW77_08385 [Actinobacteria bacterium]|nr:hypothetical protein [Actinomycetota bacterium]
MSRSRRPGDDREERGRSDADRESTKSFDEAEALFRAALDEVRGLQAALGEARSGPDAEPGDPWAVRTPDRPASTRRRRTPPRTDPVLETTGVEPGEDRPGRRRRTAPTAISPGDEGSDGSGDTDARRGSDPAAGPDPTPPTAGRSGRWARRAAPVGGPPGVGDPDDLTGDLFEGRDRSGALPPTVTENAVVVDPASAAPVPAPAAAEAYAAVAAGIAGSAGAGASGSVDHVDAIDTAPRPGPRRRPGLVVAVAAGLAAALVLALLVLPGGDDDPALRTAPAARYTFPTTSTPEGAEVSRTWELRGADGDRFVGRLVLTNPRPTAVAVRVTETIPKAIAPSVQQIRFRPQPIVVQADPVVRYDVIIPAGGRFTAEYTTSVAPEGPRRARLAAWALLLTPPPTTPTTTPPVTAPPAPTPTPGPTTPRTPVTTPATVPPTSPPTPPPTTPPPPPPTATGVIVMRVVSQGGTGSFFLTGPGGSATVETSGSPNGFGQTGFTVAVGVSPWTLQPADGWDLVGGSCQDRGGESDSSVVGNTAFFHVQADETVICTFTVRRR